MTDDNANALAERVRVLEDAIKAALDAHDAWAEGSASPRTWEVSAALRKALSLRAPGRPS